MGKIYDPVDACLLGAVSKRFTKKDRILAPDVILMTEGDIALGMDGSMDKYFDLRDRGTSREECERIFSRFSSYQKGEFSPVLATYTFFYDHEPHGLTFCVSPMQIDNFRTVEQLNAFLHTGNYKWSLTVTHKPITEDDETYLNNEGRVLDVLVTKGTSKDGRETKDMISDDHILNRYPYHEGNSPLLEPLKEFSEKYPFPSNIDPVKFTRELLDVILSKPYRRNSDRE